MGVFKKNNKWWIDYTVNGKRVRTPVSESKVTAQKVLTKIKADILQKKYSLPNTERMKFVDFAEKYINEHARIANKNWKNERYRLKALLPFFGDMYIDEITEYHYAQYRKIRRNQKSKFYPDRNIGPTTINNEGMLLTIMLNRAVTWGFLIKNPLAKLPKYKVEPKERILTQEEIKRLVAHATPPLKNIILVALNTGMRKREILDLEWNQVNIQDRFITVKKTKSSRIRRIPLNNTLVSLFYRMNEQRQDDHYVFPCKKTGKPYRHITKPWKKILGNAGITDMRFHDMRHCFATYALLNGGDLISLKETLGHADISTTARYTKALMEGQRKLVNAFEVKESYGEIVDFPGRANNKTVEDSNVLKQAAV